MSDMKPAQPLKDVLKPPFYHDSVGMIYDGNSRLVDVPGQRLSGEPDSGEQCAKVRGWGFFQYYENGEELQDAFMDFLVEALNEKCERERQRRAELKEALAFSKVKELALETWKFMKVFPEVRRIRDLPINFLSELEKYICCSPLCSFFTIAGKEESGFDCDKCPLHYCQGDAGIIFGKWYSAKTKEEKQAVVDEYLIAIQAWEQSEG